MTIIKPEAPSPQEISPEKLIRQQESWNRAVRQAELDLKNLTDKLWYNSYEKHWENSLTDFKAEYQAVMQNQLVKEAKEKANTAEMRNFYHETVILDWWTKQLEQLNHISEIEQRTRLLTQLVRAFITGFNEGRISPPDYLPHVLQWSEIPDREKWQLTAAYSAGKLRSQACRSIAQVYEQDPVQWLINSQLDLLSTLRLIEEESNETGQIKYVAVQPKESGKKNIYDALEALDNQKNSFELLNLNTVEKDGRPVNDRDYGQYQKDKEAHIGQKRFAVIKDNFSFFNQWRLSLRAMRQLPVPYLEDPQKLYTPDLSSLDGLMQQQGFFKSKQLLDTQPEGSDQFLPYGSGAGGGTTEQITNYRTLQQSYQTTFTSRLQEQAPFHQAVDAVKQNQKQQAQREQEI